jgi:NhaP-type Na+/H+ or K+/H+ antiporter
MFWAGISALGHYAPDSLGALKDSMDLWIAIDPHLLLFAFLPALLFGDAKSTDTHLLARKGKEIVTLASLGVLLGTGFSAVVAKHLLPYGWGWNLSLVMGTILSATDPVAVVGLLNQLGAPPAITMVIAGESMFNDGTAIVVFKYEFSIHLAHHTLLTLSTASSFRSTPRSTPSPAASRPTRTTIWTRCSCACPGPPARTRTNTSTLTPPPPPPSASRYAFQAVFGGMLFGVLGGMLVVGLLELFDSKLHEDNALLQLTSTLSMAYIVFYVAEGVYGTSGVIATVTVRASEQEGASERSE